MYIPMTQLCNLLLIRRQGAQFKVCLSLGYKEKNNAEEGQAHVCVCGEEEEARVRKGALNMDNITSMPTTSIHVIHKAIKQAPSFFNVCFRIFL